MDSFAFYLIWHDKSILLVEWYTIALLLIISTGLGFLFGRLYQDMKHIDDAFKNH